jgi:hypothetical protein
VRLPGFIEVNDFDLDAYDAMVAAKRRLQELFKSIPKGSRAFFSKQAFKYVSRVQLYRSPIVFDQKPSRLEFHWYKRGSAARRITFEEALEIVMNSNHVPDGMNQTNLMRIQEEQRAMLLSLDTHERTMLVQRRIAAPSPRVRAVFNEDPKQSEIVVASLPVFYPAADYPIHVNPLYPIEMQPHGSYDRVKDEHSKDEEKIKPRKVRSDYSVKRPVIDSLGIYLSEPQAQRTRQSGTRRHARK